MKTTCFARRIHGISTVANPNRIVVGRRLSPNAGNGISRAIDLLKFNHHVLRYLRVQVIKSNHEVTAAGAIVQQPTTANAQRAAEQTCEGGEQAAFDYFHEVGPLATPVPLRDIAECGARARWTMAWVSR